MQLQNQTEGRGVFIRHLLEQLDDGFEKPLRDATEKARNAVIEAGGTCSVGYVKSMRVELGRAGYVKTRKKGKSWVIGMTLWGQDEWTIAKNLDWGHTIGHVEKDNENKVKADEMTDKLSSSVVRVKPTDDRPSRMKAFELWRDGLVKMYMVPSDARVGRTKNDPNRVVIQLSNSEVIGRYSE